MPPVAKPIADRFWPKVRKTQTCWLWVGAINTGNGYGQIGCPRSPRSSSTNRTVQLYAHRVSWELANGPIPVGQSVLHRCDVPACVNPGHLFLGTHKTNMEDAASKGRLHVPRPSRRKLSDVERELVRQRYATGGVTLKALAQEHGVTVPFIWQIVHRRSVEFRAKASATGSGSAIGVSPNPTNPHERAVV